MGEKNINRGEECALKKEKSIIEKKIIPSSKIFPRWFLVLGHNATMGLSGC